MNPSGSDFSSSPSEHSNFNAGENAVLACENLVKTYTQGPQDITVLNTLNFRVCKGDSVAIVGQSGSGKTTLLNMLGGLDSPTSGRVFINGEDIAKFDEKRRGLVRNRHLGFVYQFHHLLGEFSAEENVAMPMLIGGVNKSDAKKQAQQMLAKVGLASRASHKPSELSGGERQRVAIARALVRQPQCVLMDEPTGNLDHETAEEIQALFMQLNSELNTSIVVVTHDLELAARMDRQVHLRDGQLVAI